MGTLQVNIELGKGKSCPAFPPKHSTFSTANVTPVPGKMETFCILSPSHPENPREDTRFEIKQSNYLKGLKYKTFPPSPIYFFLFVLFTMKKNIVLGRKSQEMFSRYELAFQKSYTNSPLI